MKYKYEFSAFISILKQIYIIFSLNITQQSHFFLFEYQTLMFVWILLAVRKFEQKLCKKNCILHD